MGHLHQRMCGWARHLGGRSVAGESTPCLSESWRSRHRPASLNRQCQLQSLAVVFDPRRVRVVGGPSSR